MPCAFDFARARRGRSRVVSSPLVLASPRLSSSLAIGFVSQKRMRGFGMAAEALEPGSSAAVLVWENVWARKFADAVRGADGVLYAWDRIPYEAVQAVIAAKAAN